MATVAVLVFGAETRDWPKADPPYAQGE